MWFSGNTGDQRCESCKVIREPREWWIWKSEKATFAYGEKPADGVCLGSIHVIEYSAWQEARRRIREVNGFLYDANKERDQLKAEIESWKIKNETLQWDKVEKEMSQLKAEVERLKGERTEVTTKGNVAYLWFSGKDGWQVTSFHPKDDPAIGFKETTKMYINYDEHLRVCKMAESYRAIIANLLPLAEHGVPEPSHAGSCTPETTCDMDCSHAFYGAMTIEEARQALEGK